MTRGPAKQFDTELALARAMEVFWVRGYEGASLTELHMRMGIGRQSLYDTYGDKRSLFLKAVEYYMRTEVAAVHARLLGPGSPLANLRGHLQRFRDFHATCPGKGCLLGVGAAGLGVSDPEVAALLRENLAHIAEVYTEAIRRAQSAGELPATLDAGAVGALLLCLTQGGALVSRTAPEAALLDAALRTVFTLLVGE
jgi:TetR/AcrR family transcriptional repressor of nem operon